MAEYMIYIWLGVILAAVVIEGLTAQLVSIWFVPGGLAGLIAGFCGAGDSTENPSGWMDCSRPRKLRLISRLTA